MRIAVAAFSIVALIGVVFAEEQVGLQPGWVEAGSIQVSKTDAFSRSGEQVTTSLELLPQGASLITYPSGDPLSIGGRFFAAHKNLNLTIRHNYPDMLPPDASVTECRMESAGVFGSYGAESEATVAECSESGTTGRGNIYALYSAYGEVSGLLPTIVNSTKFAGVFAFVEYRYHEDDDPRGHARAFTSATAGNLSYLSSSPDIMNMTFRVSAQHQDLLTGDWVPDEGLEVRVRYVTTHIDLGQKDVYISDWTQTDEEGEALVDVGGGGEIVDTDFPIDVATPYAIVSANAAEGYGGYGTNRARLDDMRAFQGTVSVKTVDPEGRAVGNARVAANGAFWADTHTDAKGELEIQVNGGGSDSREVTLALPPRLWPDVALTQIVDGTEASQLHSESPVYYVPKFRIYDAINYATGGDTFDDLTLRIYENGVQVAEIDGIGAKHEAWVTDDERARAEVNEYWYPVLPSADVRNYRFDVTWKDDLDEDVKLIEWLGETAIRENRVPALERPFRVHFVGIETPGVMTLRGKGVRETWTSTANMAAMNKFFQALYPAPVEFTVGPDIKSSDPWYMIGPWSVLSYFVDVAKHRDAMPNRPDLIVGVAGPGVIGADGLSEPRFRNAILLDGSAMRESYLLHEYMHTLGKLDNYDYETGEKDRGASANGYDPRTATRVYNRPGADKPAFQTIMYDHAPNPWFTRQDYDTLLDEATAAMMYNLDGTRKKQTKAMGANDPGDAPRAAAQEVMIVGAPFMGRQTWDDYIYSLKEAWPIFVDWDSPWQPSETFSPSGRALGVRLSNGQTASVHEHTEWIGGPSETALAAAPMFKIPYDPSVDSVTFQVWRQDGGIDTIQTIPFSANPPEVTIESPGAGAQLQGNAKIVFHATDPDAGEQLYAWVKISNDAGATWSPVGNWFSVNAGRNEFQLPCDSLPENSDARLRILVSDGTRSDRADVGSLGIVGYTTTPRVEARPGSIDATVPAASHCVLPVRIANTGGSELKITPDSGALPAWISCRLRGEQAVPPGAEIEFLYDARLTTAGLFSTTLVFATNAPASVSVGVALSLNATTESTAPIVASLVSDPASDGGFVAVNAPIRFVAREMSGRAGMQGRIEILHAETEELIDTADFTPGAGDGQYVALWEVPPERLGEPIGIEARLEDPVSGLADSDGSRSTGWDLEMCPIRNNTAPRFVNPVGDTFATITYPGYVQIPFDTVDDEGDPVSYAVRHTPDLDVKLDADAKTMRVTYLLGVDGYESKVQLIATDRWGASSRVEIVINIYWPSGHYAWLVDHDSVWLDGDTKPLTIAGGGLFEHPTQVHIDARAQGASEWTRLASRPYNQWNNTHQCYLVEYEWQLPDDGADAYELQLTLVDSSGTPDPDPSIYVFERVRQGGRVVRIEAPDRVLTGEIFNIRVHVENTSSQRWSQQDGYGLKPLDPTDPLSGLGAVAFPALQQVERGTADIVDIVVQAPESPGTYRSAWSLCRNGVAFGDSAQVWVGVAASALDPLLAGLSAFQTCHIEADSRYWLGAFNFLTTQWQATFEATGDATMDYALPSGQWLGLYLYDYDAQVWVRGWYVYKHIYGE